MSKFESELRVGHYAPELDGPSEYAVLDASGGSALATVWGGDDEAKAYTELFSAAPELLEALKLIKSQSIGSDWTAEQALAFIKETANAAIARAEGGQSCR